MQPSVDEIEGQLAEWRLEIDRLADNTQRAGHRAGFDAIMGIDELKALHAIAQSKLVEFKAAENSGSTPMESEMREAWNSLKIGLRDLMP